MIILILVKVRYINLCNDGIFKIFCTKLECLKSSDDSSSLYILTSCGRVLEASMTYNNRHPNVHKKPWIIVIQKYPEVNKAYQERYFIRNSDINGNAVCEEKRASIINDNCLVIFSTPFKR